MPTLRLIATGESYTNLHYSTRIATNTLSILIPDTLNAIYEAFKDEIKVFIKIKSINMNLIN